MPTSAHPGADSGYPRRLWFSHATAMAGRSRAQRPPRPFWWPKKSVGRGGTGAHVAAGAGLVKETKISLHDAIAATVAVVNRVGQQRQSLRWQSAVLCAQASVRRSIADARTLIKTLKEDSSRALEPRFVT